MIAGLGAVAQGPRETAVHAKLRQAKRNWPRAYTTITSGGATLA